MSGAVDCCEAGGSWVRRLSPLLAVSAVLTGACTGTVARESAGDLQSPSEADSGPRISLLDGAVDVPKSDSPGGSIHPDACGSALAPYGSASCTSSAAACLATCAGQDSCALNCIAREPDPAACYTCVEHETTRCIAERGCQAEVSASLCCIHQHCGDESGQSLSTCQVEQCGAETDAVLRCAATSAPGCLGSLTSGPRLACFAAGA